MIQVKRTEEPPNLTRNKDRWLIAYLSAISNYNLNKTPANKTVKTNAENKYQHLSIKRKLKDMFNDKCAYCESFISHITYGHIEHYKPKSKFPSECFEWSNLLLGCDVCNGKQYKGNKFPSAAEGGPVINPVDENPFDFFSFEYDPLTGTANVSGKNERGITSENLLGLNRPALVKHRSKIVRRIIFIAIKASQGDNDALLEMKKLILPDDEYSAFSIEIFYKLNLHKYQYKINR